MAKQVEFKVAIQSSTPELWEQLRTHSEQAFVDLLRFLTNLCDAKEIADTTLKNCRTYENGVWMGTLVLTRLAPNSAPRLGTATVGFEIPLRIDGANRKAEYRKEDGWVTLEPDPPMGGSLKLINTIVDTLSIPRPQHNEQREKDGS